MPFAKNLHFLAFTALLISSCSSEPETTDNDVPQPVRGVLPTTTEQPEAATTNATPSGDMPALNPPHGEPFHRCDIAVGAPLEGSPAPGGQSISDFAQPDPIQIQAPSGASTTFSSEGVTSPVQTPGSARINPPHGEPGHDCAVPVGQPLPG